MAKKYKRGALLMTKQGMGIRVRKDFGKELSVDFPSGSGWKKHVAKVSKKAIAYTIFD